MLGWLSMRQVRAGWAGCAPLTMNESSGLPLTSLYMSPPFRALSLGARWGLKLSVCTERHRQPDRVVPSQLPLVDTLMGVMLDEHPVGARQFSHSARGAA